MIRSLSVFVLFFTALAGFSTAGLDRREAAGLHLALDRSDPVAGAEVHMVPEVFLGFTEAPQDNSVSIRLIDFEGESVEVGAVIRDPEDAAVFSAPVRAILAPGEYTVSWRAMGLDGHVVRGDFTFSVSAH